MKKVLIASLALLVTACPVACVNDPTEDTETMTDVDTCSTVSDQITDAVTQCTFVTSTLVDTSTETAVH